MTETATSSYFCESCNEERDDDVCPICGQQTSVSGVQASDSQVLKQPLGSLPTKEKTGERHEQQEPSHRLPVIKSFVKKERADADRVIREEPRNEVETRFPPPPKPKSIHTEELTIGSETGAFRASQREIAEYLDEGFEIFLIAGIAGSGKTELLESFKEGRTLRQVTRKDGMAIPTAPGNFECHPLPHGRRKLLFVDASGEHFRQLYSDASIGAQIDSEEVLFLRLIARRLSGLILLLNLRPLWINNDSIQITVLRNILILLRFLKGGGSETGVRNFEEQVDAQIGKLPRLRIPVQFLMSRADQLLGLELPSRPDDSWLSSEAPPRKLFPRGEQPLLIAHHYLPQLVRTLEEHTHTFRVDFVHSLVTDEDTGAVTNHQGCGVNLTRDWLIETSARPWWTLLPTRYSLGCQQSIDGLLRRDRWIQMPGPRSPKGRQ